MTETDPMIEVSFHEDNLFPFLTAVGWLVDHKFDPDDWIAVSHGVRDTDAEAGQWYDFEFHQGRRTKFAVAFDESGTSWVRCRVDLPAEYESRLQLLADFCGRFHWRG